MSGMAWFRMYGEMIDDPKIGSLTDSEFRTWVELLCCACKYSNGGDTGLTSQQLTWSLRRNIDSTLQRLFDENLIAESDKKTIVIKNWEKRQFKSDSSKKRVDKCRKNKKKKVCNGDVTLQKRYSNALDTDTDTDTDTDKNKKNKQKKGALFRSDEQKENVFEIFNFWASTLNHEKAKLDSKRAKKIIAALELDFSVEDLKLVPLGCKRSAYHMGTNDENKVHDGILCIYRDAEQIEKFINLAKSPGVTKQQNYSKSHLPQPTHRIDYERT